MFLILTLGLICAVFGVALVIDFRRIRRTLKSGVAVKAVLSGFSNVTNTSVPIFQITLPDGTTIKKGITADSRYYRAHRSKEYSAGYDAANDSLVLTGWRFSYDSTIILTIFFFVFLGLLTTVIITS